MRRDGHDQKRSGITFHDVKILSPHNGVNDLARFTANVFGFPISVEPAKPMGKVNVMGRGALAAAEI